MSAHRLRAIKRALRREILAARDALGAGERAARSRRIAERVLALPELRGARTVMAFASFGSEVDTRPLLEALAERGLRLAVPRVVDGGLVPVAYVPGDPLEGSSFGVPEPTTGAPIPPAEIDLVVAPGLAFDRSGARVGYGGGFYDRFLRTLPPGVPRIAVAFAIQVVPQVPRGGSDVPVDAIVTELEVIRCPR